MIALVTIIFNVSIKLYIERDILGQLNKIASHTEATALKQGPEFFPKPNDNHNNVPPPILNSNTKSNTSFNESEMFRYYFMLDKSLREPLSVLNADYILFDINKKRITPSPNENNNSSAELLNKLTKEINLYTKAPKEAQFNIKLSGIKYVVIIKPVAHKNSFGLGWIIIYSSLQEINQLQIVINIILFIILVLSALIIVVFSSMAAKKISAPFSALNEHIREISERNFSSKINIPVDDELRDFVNNINVMSEKLEIYDKAQKTFLQNASHEFRTPLMSIQSYAEGIKYEVVEPPMAAQIIIDESKRMATLVDDLLYLSRLNAIEENYHFEKLDLFELVNTCVERMYGIATTNNIKLLNKIPAKPLMMYADEEKLSRGITNILSNCLRYATETIVIDIEFPEPDKISLIISDDGPGFEVDELSNIFERFYKGKNGVFGLGLAISTNVIEKHHGKITANNSESGALFVIELPISM